MKAWRVVASFGGGLLVGALKGTKTLRRAENAAIRWGRERGLWNGDHPGSMQIRDLMTVAPQTVVLDTSLQAAARLMADDDIGDVLVTEQSSGRVAGIVTDRDLAIRAVAEGMDPETTTVGEIFSRDLVAVSPSDDVRHVLGLMRDLKVRRLPVVESERAIGIVSLGDLSIDREVGSTLASISAAAPDR